MDSFTSPQQPIVTNNLLSARLPISGNSQLKEQLLSGKIRQSPAITSPPDLRQQESPRRIQKSPAIYSTQDCQSPAITSLKIKYCPQDCQSPAITSLKNKHCPARAGNPRQLLSGQIFLWTIDLCMNKSLELPYYARLFQSLELYWSFYKLC